MIDYGIWQKNVSELTTILESAAEDFRKHLTEGHFIQEPEPEYPIDDECLGGTCQDGVCVAAPPTRDDGLQNGNELGVDCGGPECDACEAASTTYFEAESGVFSGDPTFAVGSAGAASGGEFISRTFTRGFPAIDVSRSDKKRFI